MHYLCAILVKLDEAVDVAILSEETLTTLHRQAREKAERAIERYFETAFDWYDDEGAGRWSELLPVALLGAEDPARFHHLLTEFAKLPMEQAQFELTIACANHLKHRSQEELDCTPGSVAISMPRYPVGEDPERPEGIWSGIYEPLPLPDKNTLETLAAFRRKKNFWEDPKYWAWQRYAHLQNALAIANGQFVTGVAFYCATYASVIFNDEIREATRQEPERFALVFLDLHM